MRGWVHGFRYKEMPGNVLAGTATAGSRAFRKRGIGMGRLIYRMCLVAALVIAIAGGIYYYMSFYQKEDAMQKGTFVNRMTAPDNSSFRQAKESVQEVKDAARQAFAYTKDAAADAKEAAKDAVQQAKELGKEVASDAKDAAQQAFMYTKEAAADAKEAASDAVHEKIKKVSGQVQAHPKDRDAMNL